MISKFELATRQTAYEYVHNEGIIIMASPTGVSHVYKITKPLQQDVFAEDVRFIYHKEHRHWVYVGMLSNDMFKLTSASRYSYNSKIVNGITYLLLMIKYDSWFDQTAMKLYRPGICKRCGRQLLDPKSIEAGVGRKCSKKMAIISDETNGVQI